jgi:hypothetical protein
MELSTMTCPRTSRSSNSADRAGRRIAVLVLSATGMSARTSCEPRAGADIIAIEIGHDLPELALGYPLGSAGELAEMARRSNSSTDASSPPRSTSATAPAWPTRFSGSATTTPPPRSGSTSPTPCRAGRPSPFPRRPAPELSVTRSTSITPAWTRRLSPRRPGDQLRRATISMAPDPAPSRDADLPRRRSTRSV